MGLDAYLFIVDNKTNESEELMYFRKFNALHGFMEDLYREKGGTEESFNCIPLELPEEDLNKLEIQLHLNLLKPRTGFFFGSQELSDYHKDDLRFSLQRIRSLREEGKDFKVLYNSFW